MERVKLYRGEACEGEVTLRPDGARTEIRASLPDPGDGLYRLVLRGEAGELMLGVMEPEGKRLTLSRRLYSRDVHSLGALKRGEARCSFRFDDVSRWQAASGPARLFHDSFLQNRLRGVERAWWRRERGQLILAIPLERGKPFPLEALFCLAKVQRVEGRVCAVYRFDGEERPLPPGE